MRAAGNEGAKRRGKPWRTTIGDPDAPRDPRVHDLRHRFPSRISEPGGKVYFSFVIDVYSRMIVGWQLATHMRPLLARCRR